MSTTDAKKLPGQKRYKLIACEIIYREACLVAGESENIVDVEFLRKGLHDAEQDKMRQGIQEAINNVAKDTYDAILLGYARCNDGVVGLESRDVPLVIPRAHDCITLFFGSKQEFEKYFSQFPGTYYRTTGWTERDYYDSDSIMTQLGLDRTFEQYAAQYGRDNAKYIMESMGHWPQNYQYITYIDMGLPLDDQYAKLAEQ